MIKIRIGSVEETFDSNKSAMAYVADMAGDKPLRFQRIVYERGEITEMDFLTYDRGRISSTHNTRF